MMTIIQTRFSPWQQPVHCLSQA